MATHNHSTHIRPLARTSSRAFLAATRRAYLAAALLGPLLASHSLHAQARTRDSAGVRIVDNAARSATTGARQIATIGLPDGDPKYLLDRVFSVALDADGNHYIGMEAELRVYDRNGRHVRTIGRKGKGPGEFGMAPGPIWFSGDSIMAMDRNIMRTTAFTMDGRVIDTYSSYAHPHVSVRPIGRTDRSWIALVEPGGQNDDYEAVMRESLENVKLKPGQVGEMPPLELRRYFPRTDSLGETVYRIRNFKLIGTTDNPPFGLTTRMFDDMDPAYALDHRGFVYAKVPTEYRIDVFDPAGKFVRSIRRDFTRIPITDKDFDGMPELMAEASVLNAIASPENLRELRKRALDRETQNIERARAMPRLPYRYPVGRLLVSPGGILWVERADAVTPGMRRAIKQNWHMPSQTRWDIFDPAGVYMTTTNLPAGYRPMAVTDDGRVAGLYEDPDRVEFVVTYQVLNRRG